MSSFLLVETDRLSNYVDDIISCYFFNKDSSYFHSQYLSRFPLFFILAKKK